MAPCAEVLHSRPSSQVGGAAPSRNDPVRVVDFKSYLHCKRRDVEVPVAIPSRGRARILCDETLKTLARYKYAQHQIYVFVNPRDDETSGHGPRHYRQVLAQAGFSRVHVVDGASTLIGQYRTIVKFMKTIGEGRVLLMSDRVPSIMWRPRSASLTLLPLPSHYLHPLVSMAFNIMDQQGARAWSGAPGKNAVNMIPARLSWKNGLLDGNFTGLNVDKMTDSLLPSVSNLTTDVELSLKVFKADGKFLRLLGVTAAHQYKTAGGHAETVEHSKRMIQQKAAIKTLAAKFPKLLSLTTKERADTCMPYAFRHRGPAPWKVRNLGHARGRRPTKKRPQSNKQRQQAWRDRAHDK